MIRPCATAWLELPVTHASGVKTIQRCSFVYKELCPARQVPNPPSKVFSVRSLMNKRLVMTVQTRAAGRNSWEIGPSPADYSLRSYGAFS